MQDSVTLPEMGYGAAASQQQGKLNALRLAIYLQTSCQKPIAQDISGSVKLGGGVTIFR